MLACGDKEAAPEDTGSGWGYACPDLRGATCSSSSDPPYYCDECELVWSCGLTSGQYSWILSTWPCECVTEEGGIDYENPNCYDTY